MRHSHFLIAALALCLAAINAPPLDRHDDVSSQTAEATAGPPDHATALEAASVQPIALAHLCVAPSADASTCDSTSEVTPLRGDHDSRLEAFRVETLTVRVVALHRLHELRHPNQRLVAHQPTSSRALRSPEHEGLPVATGVIGACKVWRG